MPDAPFTIEDASTSVELNFAAEVARLAQLPGAEYDRARVAVAKQLQVRASTLDAEVKRLRAGTSTSAAPEFSDDALALRFTDRHRHDLRFVATWNHWYRWTGTVWQQEDTLAAFDLARDICREAAKEADRDDAPAIASARTVAAVERLARADRAHAATVDQWDADLWLLNTPGGTIDLRTGRMHRHDPLAYVTKTTAVTPDATAGCPTWLRFLDTITAGDAELIRFLQRAAGYALTGSTREHALFFGYGTGGNGKGVFLNTLSGIFGDYATIAPMETFAATQTDRHPTELAMLRGARLVTAQETEQGRAWAESRIKSLTGGDPITARFMHKDFFTFQPQFKLFIAGNHKPALRNVDEAMRRRMHMVPFTVTIPPEQRNPNLAAELKAEWPAILAWAIAGCLDWQRHGLAAPAAVTDATNEYLKGEDAFGQWVDECCEVGRHREEGSSALYAAWRAWAERAGEQPGTQKRFSQSLLERGYQACRLPNGKAAFKGIGLPIPRPRHETAADRD